MKKITLFFSLLGCISLCSHAWLHFPYDRSIDPRSSELTRHTIAPADSSLTANIYGVEMSAMDYAEIYITVAPDTNFTQQAFAHIVGYGPSPRLKSLDKTSTERQKLIISDDDFYKPDKRESIYGDVFEYRDPCCAVIPPREDRRRVINVDAMADYLTFDFDLSEYACDFDVYFLILDTDIIFDNAFSIFKLSDNVKSVNLYFG